MESKDKHVGLLLLTVLAVGFLIGSVGAENAKVPQTIDASCLRIVDEDGNPRLILQLDSKGAAEVLVGDAEGRVRTRLGTLENGFSGVFLTDSEGRFHSGWSTLKDEATAWVMCDRAANTRSAIEVPSEGAAQWTLHDRTGRPSVLAQSGSNGNDGIAILSDAGSPVAVLGQSIEDGEEGAVSLSLYDDKARRVGLSVIDGAPFLELLDEKEVARGSWTFIEGGCAIQLNDAKGTSRALFGATPSGACGIQICGPKGNVVEKWPENFDRESSTRRRRR